MRCRPVVAAAVVVALSAPLAACGGTDLKGAPNVEGLPLPDAKQQLKSAGFTAAVKTEALFGVIVESHYTVCKENSPNGRLVPIDVEKQC